MIGKRMPPPSFPPANSPGRAEPIPVTRLFTRRFRPDALGFLDTNQSPELYRVEHLFEHPAVVIVAPPWMGKTTVASQLHEWLRAQPIHLSFDKYLCLLRFDIHGEERNLPPIWWDEWRQNTQTLRACWIIDGFDEGEERLGGIRERILHLVSELDDCHRANLRLLIFSRQREWLTEFRASLGEAYVLRPLQELPEVQLAPLHEQAARDMLGSLVAFDRVADLIRQHGLQPVAGYPAALKFLGLQSGDTHLSVVDVWRGVLKHLLQEPDSSRRLGLRSEAEDRFEAACRISAVLTLTNSTQVVDCAVATEMPTLADIFRAPGDRSLRVPGREACEVGPFLNTPEGGYRLSQRNIQNWLAAFGLANLRLGPLRSALGDGERKVFSRHRDLLPLLGYLSADVEVRDWIEGLGKGLPLPSDLIGLSLTKSLGYIDQLEGILAGSSPGM
jgi:hypothetical protein